MRTHPVHPPGYGPVVELCQSVLDGRRMPDEWALSVVVPIFKGKGDATSCLFIFFFFAICISLRSNQLNEPKKIGNQSLFQVPG